MERTPRPVVRIELRHESLLRFNSDLYTASSQPRHALEVRAGTAQLMEERRPGRVFRSDTRKRSETNSVVVVAHMVGGERATSLASTSAERQTAFWDSRA